MHTNGDDDDDENIDGINQISAMQRLATGMLLEDDNLRRKKKKRYCLHSVLLNFCVAMALQAEMAEVTHFGSSYSRSPLDGLKQHKNKRDGFQEGFVLL